MKKKCRINNSDELHNTESEKHNLKKIPAFNSEASISGKNISNENLHKKIIELSKDPLFIKYLKDSVNDFKYVDAEMDDYWDKTERR
jgi:hypothetical protein